MLFSKMRELGDRLAADPHLVAEAEASLRIGVHWSTSVKPPAKHEVAQVYASALPVAYAKSTKSKDWEPFARLVLRATYDATLCAARVKLQRDTASGAGTNARNGRQAVFLTMLGGNAFGNRKGWISDAIVGALDTHRDAPLDVYLVHYGSVVKQEFKGIKVPQRRTAAAASPASGTGGDSEEGKSQSTDGGGRDVANTALELAAEQVDAEPSIVETTERKQTVEGHTATTTKVAVATAGMSTATPAAPST
eukprot:FR739586.1.p1 GENE.FR739586.1~~FR739586.1.p1  ORF type:complete len:251 (+),score=19.41 FR739586.1:47-799(+)